MPNRPTPRHSSHIGPTPDSRWRGRASGQGLASQAGGRQVRDTRRGTGLQARPSLRSDPAMLPSASACGSNAASLLLLRPTVCLLKGLHPGASARPKSSLDAKLLRFVGGV